MSARRSGSRVKFYLDEHVSKAVAKALRVRGVDVLTVAEAGLLGATDMEHLALAALERRVVFTHDADFLRLHAGDVDHAGIVFAAKQSSIRAVVQGLMMIHAVLTAEDMRGHVEFL